jgi:hypothetical protein
MSENNTGTIAISYLVDAYRHSQFRVKHLQYILEEDRKKHLSRTEEAINGWKKHGELILAQLQEYADANKVKLSEILDNTNQQSK